MSEIESKDTSIEYDTMEGVSGTAGASTLHKFLGEELTPETEDKAWMEKQNELYKLARESWTGMPEFISDKVKPELRVQVYFSNEEDLQKFSELVGQNITKKTKSIFYPEKIKDNNLLRRWIGVTDED